MRVHTKHYRTVYANEYHIYLYIHVIVSIDKKVIVNGIPLVVIILLHKPYPKLRCVGQMSNGV